MSPVTNRKRWGLGIGAALLVIVVVGATRALMGRHKAPDPAPLEAIGRRDIAQTVEATGTVQPIQIVEIKSKASGQILRLPVELGSDVRTGGLLAQIDTVTVRNQYAQALAALEAAQANVQITTAQKQRADDLYSREVMTVDQHESATLAAANARSQLANARSNLDIARQAMDDADVRAPSNGTVIELDVTKGQVIASATSSASGGTTLLKMADLTQVEMQALVGETDIGNVQPGQRATVSVDAFPNRTFEGVVLKIEPQAVVQQSVTMFPVLVTISNQNRQLLPGMNGEVTVQVAERQNVIAVPVDAVRSAREASTVATVIGLDPDSVRAQVQRMVAARMAARRGAFAGGGADSARGGAGGGLGRFRGAGGDSLRARGGMWGGGMGRGAGGGAGGRNGGARGAGGGFAFRGGGADSTRGGGGGRGGAGGGGGRQASVVFIQGAHGLEPRLVRLGVSDFDYAEVLSGLAEGDRVALLSVAEVQAKRQQDLNRVMQRVGTGMPGVGGGGGGGGRGAGGGGGGGGR